jgi:hypothetical protein
MNEMVVQGRVVIGEPMFPDVLTVIRSHHDDSGTGPKVSRLTEYGEEVCKMSVGVPVLGIVKGGIDLELPLVRSSDRLPRADSIGDAQAVPESLDGLEARPSYPSNQERRGGVRPVALRVVHEQKKGLSHRSELATDPLVDDPTSRIAAQESLPRATHYPTRTSLEIETEAIPFKTSSKAAIRRD